jgi:uroporphyrinogen-III synthase
MRVLITRPEREAAALAAALGERGHVPVAAPLFRLRVLPAPTDFAARLAESQAVLLTSANGARALADASEQRGFRVFAVGDTTASTAEGLGFSRVVTAAGDGAALAELVRQRLDPKAGPLLHISGSDVATDFAEALAPHGFTVNRAALYEAREVETLPEAALSELRAGTLDAATFFSPRAAQVFVHLVNEAGLTGALGKVSAIAISPAAAQPLEALEFRQIIAAARPTRQAVLDEIDRVIDQGATPGVQGQQAMSDTPPPSAPPPPAPPAPAPVQIRRGLGVIGAFICGLIASVAVLAAAVATLPSWPADLRALWRGEPPAPPQQVDVAALRREATAAATQAATQAANSSAQAQVNSAIEATKRELAQRLDDIDKRVRAAATTAATPTPDPAIAELRKRIDALEARPAEAGTTPAPTTPAPAPAADNDKDVAALRAEIAALRTALQALDQTVGTHRDQVRALATTVERSAVGGDQKAMAAARASAVIGVAARLSAALESGLPFTTDLGLLAPLGQGDAKLGEVIAALQAQAASGVATRQVLAAEFPAMAKAALADDLADDSFGERVLGKIRNLISLRRVGADVAGETTEARLARAEAAIEAGDVAKAAALVKSLPPQTARATEKWLARAEGHLAARRAVDQLAAHAVTLLGASR